METKEKEKKKLFNLEPHFCITGAIMGLIVLMSLIIIIGQRTQFSSDFNNNIYRSSILIIPDEPLYIFIVIAHIALLLFSIYRMIFGSSAKESLNRNLMILNITLILSLGCITFWVPAYVKREIPKGGDTSQMSSIITEMIDIYGIPLTDKTL
jgi:hypothetical protein